MFMKQKLVKSLIKLPFHPHKSSGFFSRNRVGRRSHVSQQQLAPVELPEPSEVREEPLHGGGGEELGPGLQLLGGVEVEEVREGASGERGKAVAGPM